MIRRKNTKKVHERDSERERERERARDTERENLYERVFQGKKSLLFIIPACQILYIGRRSFFLHIGLLSIYSLMISYKSCDPFNYVPFPQLSSSLSLFLLSLPFSLSLSFEMQQRKSRWIICVSCLQKRARLAAASGVDHQRP